MLAATWPEKPIYLVAPASGIALDRLQALKSALRDAQVIIPDQLITSESLFHASSDENRFQQFMAACTDETTDGIVWALRGGYGSARLLARLQQAVKPPRKKIFIGCSDNTALHLFLSQHWQWAGIHGAGLAQCIEEESRDAANFSRLLEIINRDVKQQTFDALLPMNHLARTSLVITGPLQGGNLTLIENSIGTGWQAQTAGTILMLEDTGEKGYRVDRSLLHLKQAGLLHGVRAVVLGEFLTPDSTGIAYALQRFADEIDIPVYKTSLFGHGKINYPFVYGARAELALTETDLALLTMYLDS